MMPIILYRAGIIEYNKAYHLQKDIRRRVIEGEQEDTLLLLEHPPVITIGKSGKSENVLASEAELAEKGVSLFFTERGGDVTYHGPGQMVAYPIIDLKKRGKDVRKYVHNLEEVVIRVLDEFSINGCRDHSHAGIWVDNNEIAAIGVSLSKWITMHGLALNVNVDLTSFSLVNPCGFTDRKATSMAAILSEEVSMQETSNKFLFHFAEVFDTDIIIESLKVPAGGVYE